MDNKLSIVSIFSCVILLPIYVGMMFFLDTSYFVYAFWHLVFAGVILWILHKYDDVMKAGFFISLVVGAILLTLNILLSYLNGSLQSTQPGPGDTPALFIVPNPYINFLVFMVMFNLPFALFELWKMKAQKGKVATIKH